MSAIRMTCPDCGQVYMAGVVGDKPWPPHVCPKAKKEPKQAATRAAAKEYWDSLTPAQDAWALRKMGFFKMGRRRGK